MKFVSREEWGARPPRSRSGIGSVYGVTIHWAGPSPHIDGHGECAGVVRSFQNYHMDHQGWSDIGYNALTCPHGYVFEGRGIGIRGAHAGTSNIGGNDHWYGLQGMIGEGDPVTDALLDGLRDGIAWFRRNGAGDRVNGHRDHHSTACPGDRLYRWSHNEPMEDDEDMPTAKEIAEAVWSYDGIQTPDQWRDKSNPNWQARWALSGAWQQATDAAREAREDRTARYGWRNKMLRRILNKAGTDEGAVAEEVLNRFPVDELAQKVADSMPEDQARRFVDELASRLGKA